MPADGEIEIAAGFDLNTTKLSDYPVYADPMEFSGTADAVIDFSNPAALSGILNFCKKKRIPPVLCTTGYSQEAGGADKRNGKRDSRFQIRKHVAWHQPARRTDKRAVGVLGTGYDVEIIERHHNRKIDAPSGTALMLAEAAASAEPYEAEYVYGRQHVRRPRAGNEIGISSLRGGTIPGEHEIVFAGTDEVIELKHTVYSREVFATGAVHAAKFMATAKEPRIYDMGDVIASK